MLKRVATSKLSRNRVCGREPARNFLRDCLTLQKVRTASTCPSNFSR